MVIGLGGYIVFLDGFVGFFFSFSYFWSIGDIMVSIKDFVLDIYLVMVFDEFGCMVIIFGIIMEFDVLEVFVVLI